MTVDDPIKAPAIGRRHLQCCLLFLCVAVSYAMRVNLSVGIVAMTDRNTANPNFPDYPWQEQTKSLILSSFFWGYALVQVPAGQLAIRFGPKIVLLCGIFVCSALTVLTPICAEIGGWPLILTLRFVEGLCSGVVFPSTHTILSKWAPIEERSSLATYSYSGVPFGIVSMLALSGVLASSSMGWPSIFYFSGGFGIIWSILWFIWGASSPNDCKAISLEEKIYIESSLGHSEIEIERRGKINTPWLEIITSSAFWGIVFTHCAYNWGFWTLLTQLPTYIKNILGLDIEENAILSSLPYLSNFLLSFVFLGVWTISRKKGWMTINAGRKIFNSIGHWIPMISLICLTFVGKNDVNVTIILLIVTVGINGAAQLGGQINHIDVAPNFAGLLIGITNCAANVMSIIAPLVVGVIVTDEKNANQWHIVFYIAAVFYLIGNSVFLLFGKTDAQPWNEGKPLTIPEKNQSVQIEVMSSYTHNSKVPI